MINSSSRFRTGILLGTLVLGGLFSRHALAESPCTDEQRIVEAIRTVFVAAVKEDLALFESVSTADFYAFDVGKRFTGNELMFLVKDAHAAGKIYVWEVTEPVVQIHGDVALITYINRGSVQDASGKTDLTWLESAFLRNEDGKWRVHFLHSTRAS